MKKLLVILNLLVLLAACQNEKTEICPNEAILRVNFEGIEYEEGFIYTLKVRIIAVANPPADASDRRYTLLKVLSKEKVN
jgi:hypothetical protein